MSLASRQASLAEPAADVAEEDAARLRQLRRLLIGPEQAQIEALRARLDDPAARAEELSRTIAEAIGIRAKQDRKLQATLQPLIEEALRISVARDPAMLATALFPIIGEAVRKAVAHALQGMFDSLNEMLDRGFSLESWRWRFEAWRTGKSYGQIALTRSLGYRVEQVFLIHRETGLLIGHVSVSDGVVQDADLVSGMLTAIQDFVRDSFGPKKSDELEVMVVGEFKLWLQHGPQALMAAVVSGQPPAELREVLVREVEAIHRDFGAALGEFNGDASPLAGTEMALRRCLLGGQRQQAKVRSKAAMWVVAGLLLLGLLTATVVRVRDNRRWARYVERLEQEPGVVVIRAQRLWFGYAVSGLRDPMAADPAWLLAETRVPARRVAEQWQPYLSLDPRFTERRRLAAAKETLEKQIIRFELNSAKLPMDQFAALETVEEAVNTLRRAAEANKASIRIEISGHTDRTGKESHNIELSQTRAESVVIALMQRGIPAGMLMARGIADSSPEHQGIESYPQELDRRVTFRVIGTNEGVQE